MYAWNVGVGTTESVSEAARGQAAAVAVPVTWFQVVNRVSNLTPVFLGSESVATSLKW